MEKLKIRAERFFLRSPNINVCFRMTIQGNISKNAFEKALSDVCKRHPILNCTIAIDDDFNAWFIPNNCTIAIDYYQCDEMPDWHVWYKKIDDMPFDFTNGPLVKICVIWKNNEIEVIILGHHIIGDGIGYFNLTKDILLALDEKLDTTPQIPPPNNEFIIKNKLDILQKIYANKLNKDWKKNRMRFSEEEYRSFFLEYRRKFTPAFYFNSIGEDDLKKIVHKCTMEKLSVNELIISAFARSFSSGKQIRVGIAINTRNELVTKPNDCMGNYLSGILVKLKFNTKNEFIRM